MDIPEDVPVHKSGRLDRSHELFIVQTAFVVLSGVCLLIRGYIKCFIIRVNLLDDYLLYGAMVGFPYPFGKEIPKEIAGTLTSFSLATLSTAQSS